MTDIDLSYAVKLAPEKAIEYFRSKGYAITFDWQEMLREAHAKAFTVAKAMKSDILQDIRGAVDSALAEGKTFKQFEKELTPLLKAKGWWGKQEVLNEATGELRMAQLGSPYRLRTIYQVNLQSSYMTGRYQSMMENVKDRPYWQYVAILDGRTRPTHRALHGKIFRYDDPIWNYLYPPNGWRCRCRVRALSAAEVESMGLTVESSKGRISFVDQPLGDSGETIRTATYNGMDLEGKRFSLTPDAGWDYNPGAAARWDIKGKLPDCGLIENISFAEPGGCIKPVGGQPTWRTLGRPDLRDVPANLRQPAPLILEAGASREAAVDVIADILNVSAENPLRIVTTPIEQVAIRYEWLPHMVGKEADKRERYANFILPTLISPFEIWAPLYNDGTIRERYIGLFEGNKDFMVVVRVNKDGSLMWNVMQAEAKKMNPHRIGGLIYAK